MLQKVINFLVLPEVPVNFEQNYLRTMNKVALWFFFLHLPVFVTIAYLNQTGAVLAALLTVGVLAGPVFAMKVLDSQRRIALVMAVSSMFMGGLLVHFGQGPVQIEMHFYFFVLLALLAVFADPMVIVAAAATAAIHHAALWLMLPESVFNYDAPFWVVGVHALFVVLESVAACFIARTFFDNIVSLENKVEERTAALAGRNRDMRTMLDAVQQGFFTIDRELRISEERSGAVDRLFGSPSGMTLPEFLNQFDRAVAEWTEFGLEDVFAEILPIEVTIDQLPERFSANDGTYSLQYTPVFNEQNELISLAVVIEDVSATVEKERLETVQREMLAMVQRLTDDKSGLCEFFDEADSIVAWLKENREQDIKRAKRETHTLKGIASIYGIERVAQVCHEIEDFIAENDQMPAPAIWDSLFVTWDSVSANFKKLVGDSGGGLEISNQQYQELFLAILNSKSHDELATHVAQWQLEPTQKRLHRIADQTKALGARLGKGEINVDVMDYALLADASHWSEFWSSFVHIVRNAADHGIESPDVRVANGKPNCGKIEISTRVDGENYIICVKDDGAGIDWEKVRAKAVSQGLECVTKVDLIDALFEDGFSTKDIVSDTSGRGVGLAAVKQATLTQRGTIEVDSELGVGTEFRFVFPIEEVAPKTIQFLSKHNVKIKDPRAIICCTRQSEATELVGI